MVESNSHDDDNEVGYCNPPKRTRFQKGKSGNPSGRPKARRSLAQDLCAELDSQAPGASDSNQRVMARNLVAGARDKNDVRAISLIAALSEHQHQIGESEMSGAGSAVDDEILEQCTGSEEGSPSSYHLEEASLLALPPPGDESTDGNNCE